MGLDSFIYMVPKDSKPPDPDFDEYPEIWYGRKVYPIHNWLSNNIEGGIENNQTVLIPKEKLFELKDIIGKLAEVHKSISYLDNPIEYNNIVESKLSKILPREEGDYGYDYYLDDILLLKNYVLDKLTDPILEAYDFYYYPSW